MKWIARSAGGVVLAALGWFLWQRVFVTEEQRIHRALASMEQGVETGNLFKLDAGIAQDYADDFGFDKAALIGAVRSFRAQYDEIFIHISDLTITIESEDKASATLIAKVLAKAKGALAESELRTDRFRLTFRKTEQGWQMTRAESPELKFD